MENKISFQDFLQKIRGLQPDDGIAYIGEFPLKVSLNMWIETGKDGTISHFSPCLNFYQSVNEDEYLNIYANFNTDEFDLSTPKGVADFLEMFARQSGIDAIVPSLEEDEAYD